MGTCRDIISEEDSESFHIDSYLVSPFFLLLHHSFFRPFLYLCCQESFLKCLFQLLRCGKMREAQEYCVQNKSYWLAASLLGSSHPFYELVESENMPNNDGDEAKIRCVSPLAMFVSISSIFEQGPSLIGRGRTDESKLESKLHLLL